MKLTPTRPLTCRSIHVGPDVRRTDGDGRVPVCELMVNNAAIANFIANGRSQQIYSAIETGGPYGMQTLDQSLRMLLEEGLIEPSVAMSLSKNPLQYQFLQEVEG